MRAVQQAGILIIEAAVQQKMRKAPMFHIGRAGQDRAIRRQGLGMALEQGPGVGQMLQYVAIDNAIDFLVREWHRGDFHIDAGDRGQPVAGDAQSGFVGIDA